MTGSSSVIPSGSSTDLYFSICSGEVTNLTAPNFIPCILVCIARIVSSILGVSAIQNSFGEVVATGTGFEDSTILELKNSRASTANIDSVRIWLGEDNEFKSFKTEQGWLGKKQLNGVIEFTSQNQVKPGESVKFGVKTIQKNPVINWKAVDSDGNVISSASTNVSKEMTTEKPELNKPKIVAIKDESSFRFIPERPAANSDFRVIGENFVPNQVLDFYIGEKLETSIKIDDDGKILFTSKTPDITDDERTEFVLQDAGGNEKIISIRVTQIENREISEQIKLSLGNTPKEVKRGDTIKLEGSATPNNTLTITNKKINGEILHIDTIQVGYNGKWSYENVIGPESNLGTLSIEISDGKNKALRNIEVISANLINISSVETMYEPGDIVPFVGTAIPNQDMSIVLEDSIGAEIFSRTISVGESGTIDFEIEIPRGSVEGTYLLLSYQGEEEGISIFGIGQQPESILVLRPTKLNFASGEIAEISIQGVSNAQVSLILIDSADREKFSDSINLGPDGKEIYKIDTDELTTGAFTLSAKRGESSGSAIFTVGLTKGSGAISIQTTRDEYSSGEQVLILGSTGAINVLLDVTVTDTNGNVIKTIETFSDRFGLFKIDNFRIPADAVIGEWNIMAKSGGNFKEMKFLVVGDEKTFSLNIDKDSYSTTDMINISGDGARFSATVTIKIFDSVGNQIDELNITAKGTGEYLTIWQIPRDIELGDYEMTADDGKSNDTVNFTIN